MKVYKVVKDENGNETTIYGSGRDIKINTKLNGESTFRYKNRIYSLSQFLKVNNKFWVNGPDWFNEFHGINFESGVLIVISNDGESLKAYTF